MSSIMSKVRKLFSRKKKDKEKIVELPAEPDVDQAENTPASSSESDNSDVDKESGSSSEEEGSLSEEESKTDKKQDSSRSSCDEAEERENSEGTYDDPADNNKSPTLLPKDEKSDSTVENPVSVEMEEEEETVSPDESFKIELNCFQDENKMPATTIKLLKKNEGGPTEYSSLSLNDLRERLTVTDKKDIWVTIRIDKNYMETDDDEDETEAGLLAVSTLFDIVLPWMTTLKIDDQTGEETCFLAEDAPKLRHLSIRSTREKLSFSNERHPPIPRSTLSRIKTLTFLHDTPHTRCVLDIEKLLTVTPRVQEIWDIPFGYLAFTAEYLHNSGKLGLVKSIDCESENLSILDMTGCMETLAEYAGELELELEKLVCLDQPNLKNAQEKDCWKAYCRFFSIVLRGTSYSLLTLEIHPRSDPSAGLKFPRTFPVLKTLVLSDPSNGLKLKRRFFGRGFDMNQTFPALENVEVIGFTGRTKWLEDFLLPHKSLDNVKSLKLWRSPLINDAMYGAFIQDFVKLFPFVKSLEIGGSKRWLEDECLSFIWNSWTNLEELCVRVEHNSEFLCLKINNLDKVITGIPEDDCVELKEPQTEEDLEHLRTRCGISNMKNLKRFSIIIDIKSHPDDPESIPSPCISSVSSVAGFKLLPGLEVTLKTPFRNGHKEVVEAMFGPIIPFVNFDPNYDED